MNRRTYPLLLPLGFGVALTVGGRILALDLSRHGRTLGARLSPYSAATVGWGIEPTSNGATYWLRVWPFTLIADEGGEATP